MNRISYLRRTLMLSVAMLLGAARLCDAVGPWPFYLPKYSVLIGPSQVARGGTVTYILRVTFTNGEVVDFPPNHGQGGPNLIATYGATLDPGIYFAPVTGTKDHLTATYTQNGVTVVSNLTITLTP